MKTENKNRKNTMEIYEIQSKKPEVRRIIVIDSKGKEHHGTKNMVTGCFSLTDNADPSVGDYRFVWMEE